MSQWPCGPTRWIEDRKLFISIPFTWNLPTVMREVRQGSLLWDRVVVGGPAVQLMPGFFVDVDYVSEGGAAPLGLLQRINLMATRTTTGCPNKCRFCGIGTGKIEGGGFQELGEWPDLPILCDNNLLAASEQHFERVVVRLEKWGWCDFNQGLDARLLTQAHADLIARIKEPIIRLALDSASEKDAWEDAFARLRKAGIAKRKIRSYALIGFRSGPDEAWDRCHWIESHGIKPLPMWFHRLDQLAPNIVTTEQEALGWSDYERRHIMQWFYQHKLAVRHAAGGTA